MRSTLIICKSRNATSHELATIFVRQYGRKPFRARLFRVISTVVRYDGYYVQNAIANHDFAISLFAAIYPDRTYAAIVITLCALCFEASKQRVLYIGNWRNVSLRVRRASLLLEEGKKYRIGYLSIAIILVSLVNALSLLPTRLSFSKRPVELFYQPFGGWLDFTTSRIESIVLSLPVVRVPG